MGERYTDLDRDANVRQGRRPLSHALTPRTGVRWALGAGAFWLSAWLMWRAGATLVPVIIGLLLAYLLLPIVSRLDRYLPRWGSILAVYLAGLALLVLGLSFVLPPAANQAGQFVQNAPGWIDQAQAFVGAQIAEFQRTASPEVQAQVNRQVQNLQGTLERNATTYVQRAGAVVINSILTLLQTITFVIGFLVIPFFLFFVLMSADRLPDAINRMLHPAIRTDFWNIWRIVDRVFGSYVRSQLLLGLIVGVMTFAGLWSLRLLNVQVSYTVLLAIIAGVGELIPVIGPILSAIPAMIVVSGNGLSPVLAVVALYIVIQQIESQILVPRIIGNTLRLHPAILLILLVLAAAVGGLPLVVLATPLAAITRDVFIYVNRRLREPPLSPHAAINGLVSDTPRIARRYELEASDIQASGQVV